MNGKKSEVREMYPHTRFQNIFVFLLEGQSKVIKKKVAESNIFAIYQHKSKLFNFSVSPFGNTIYITYILYI